MNFYFLRAQKLQIYALAVDILAFLRYNFIVALITKRSTALVMKKIEGILLRACGFTVAILVIFYLFAVATSFVNPEIGFPTFLLILFFGFVISLSTLIFEIKALKYPFRILIHYAVLLIAFCVIFVNSGNLSAGGDAAIFTAVAIFTVLYALIFALTYLVLRAVRATDRRLETATRKKDAKNSKKEKSSTYQPRYK